MPVAHTASKEGGASTDAADQLQLMWLASPALPIGGFSYSEVLESAIERSGLRTMAAVGRWLRDQLHLVQARGDMALVAQAITAWRASDHARVNILNDWVLHTRESSELRLQTELDDDTRQAFAPMFAILSAQHETQYSRLF